jgi:uncharacterized protein
VDDPEATLALWDYRRRVADLYTTLRQYRPDTAAWEHWIEGRHVLFANHSQSPFPADRRPHFSALTYFPYEEAWRVTGRFEAAEPQHLEVAHNAEGTTPFVLFGRVYFEVMGTSCALPLLWLDAYGGGVLLAFRDATNGETTYGGGRYLLDTAKGADLGWEDDRIVLDFNFAYHPSCVHDPGWSCPLPLDEARLPIAVTAGERFP